MTKEEFENILAEYDFNKKGAEWVAPCRFNDYFTTGELRGTFKGTAKVRYTDYGGFDFEIYASCKDLDPEIYDCCGPLDNSIRSLLEHFGVEKVPGYCQLTLF